MKMPYKKTKGVRPDDIVDLLVSGETVCIFQGKVEAGPRALGNRSILFDPRNPQAQTIVNSAKRRELWRPFAASVLEEHAHEWFEMGSLQSSPFMMFAIPVKSEKRNLIPGVTHVDGTCRIQTVSKTDNLLYRELIEKFFERTGIPMVFNTSFNLAGDVICYTLEDAIRTIEAGTLKYLYLPESLDLYYVGD